MVSKENEFSEEPAKKILYTGTNSQMLKTVEQKNNFLLPWHSQTDMYLERKRNSE